MYFVASTFSFRILYAYNYNSASTVFELSETDNITEQRYVVVLVQYFA